MGGGGGGGGGGADRNRGIEKGRTKQAAVGVSKSVSVDVGEKNLNSQMSGTPNKAVQALMSTKPAPKVATPSKPTGKVGFGAEVIDTAAAQAQLSARQKDIMDSPLSKVPSVGGIAASLMGNASLAAQQKALAKGGTAVAVPGTSFAPQGQAYTEAPGMRSSAELAGQRFAVGSQGKPSLQGPAGSIGKISATKPPKGSGLGYVGDVAGVTKTTEIMGIPVTTFTGKTGYSPTGEKMAKPTGGGKETPSAPATEPEVTPEVTPEIVPDDTILPSKTRRTRFKRVGQGGTILEGFGALYK